MTLAQLFKQFPSDKFLLWDFESDCGCKYFRSHEKVTIDEDLFDLNVEAKILGRTFKIKSEHGVSRRLAFIPIMFEELTKTP